MLLVTNTHMGKMGKKRIIWIDWAKSLCMFLVVLGHCHIQPSMHLLTQIIYSFHIPLFFFISGLLSPKSSSKSSVLKDIRYIIIPYFIFGILQIVFHSLLSRDFSFYFYLINIRSLCIGTDANIGAIWFLPALFICKQLYFLLLWIKKKSFYAYIIILVLSLLLTYFISLYDINLMLFADSALFGLPFFLIGNNSSFLYNGNWHKNTFIIVILSIILLASTIILSKFNGFVSIAICDYGNNLFLYYINAITGIAASIGICLLLRNHCIDFIYITSYGTIVTLGFHGSILLVLQYYIPMYLGFYTPSINLPIAFLYSSIAYIICYIIILLGDYHCPQLIGLKGRLQTNKQLKTE